MPARRAWPNDIVPCPQLLSCAAARRVPEPSYPSPEQIGLLHCQMISWGELQLANSPTLWIYAQSWNSGWELLPAAQNVLAWDFPAKLYPFPFHLSWLRVVMWGGTWERDHWDKFYKGGYVDSVSHLLVPILGVPWHFPQFKWAAHSPFSRWSA